MYRVITIKHILRPHATNLQPLVLTLWPRRHATFLFPLFSPSLNVFALSSPAACSLLFILVFFVFISFSYSHSCFPFALYTHREKKPHLNIERAICVNVCRQCDDSQLYIHTTQTHCVVSAYVCVSFCFVCTSLSMCNNMHAKKWKFTCA